MEILKSICFQGSYPQNHFVFHIIHSLTLKIYYYCKLNQKILNTINFVSFYAVNNWQNFLLRPKKRDLLYTCKINDL